jgi:hypothetical protein
MLGTLGELSLFALVFSDFLIEGAHRGSLWPVVRQERWNDAWS